MREHRDTAEIPEFIDKRNRRLVALIAKLKLGIHILNFPEKPMFYSSDYRLEYSGYVKNFNLILKTHPWEGKEFLNIKLEQELINDDMAVERLSYVFMDWMSNCEHKRCWVVRVKDTKLMLTGYNHHDRLNRTRAYPVFAEYNPHIYYEYETVIEILGKFNSDRIPLYT